MGNPVLHFEVCGTDTAGLVKFYSELFGWHVTPMPGMETMYATVDTHAGTGINGGVGISEDGQKYVTFYIGVDDTDAMLGKIEKAGGETVHPTVEIPGVVTFAQFRDPAGNRVGLVKDDPAQAGPGVSQGSNPEVGWFEILGQDIDALSTFYSSLFGWKLDRHEMGPNMSYCEVDTGNAGSNIRGGIGNSFDGKPHSGVYAGVDDVTKALEQAETLGGTIVMKETPVTEGTIIGQFNDPQGNLFGVYKRMPQ